MSLGRYQLGAIVPLSVWCVDGNRTPTLPVRSPVALVYSETGLVLTQRLPIMDRFQNTAYFLYRQNVDSRFAEGKYTVVYNYKIGSTDYGETDDFEVVGGGHPDGLALSMYYFALPTMDYVLTHNDSGRIIRRRNPRLP